MNSNNIVKDECIRTINFKFTSEDDLEIVEIELYILLSNKLPNTVDDIAYKLNTYYNGCEKANSLYFGAFNKTELLEIADKEKINKDIIYQVVDYIEKEYSIIIK